MSSSLANLDAREGTVLNTTEISFNWKPRRIIITNDSTSGDLKFKFNTSEAYATLKPTETITLNIAHKIVLLSGNSIPYRVWGMG